MLLGLERVIGVSPHRALGLELPKYDFWELLRSDPEELTQGLSIPRNAERDNPGQRFFLGPRTPSGGPKRAE